MYSEATTTNLDQDYIDKILQEMLSSNLVHNRTTESRPSYNVTCKNGDPNVDTNNTGNPECMSDNGFDELDLFYVIVTRNSKRDEIPENLDKTTLQSVLSVSVLFCYRRN